MKEVLECVPNISEGRDEKLIKRIVDIFQKEEEVHVLDYSSDEDHNRSVITMVGSKAGLQRSLIKGVLFARDHMDLRKHVGEHPRMGAFDVIPLIPLEGITEEEAIAFSKELASGIHQKTGVPIFLYEKSATAPHRKKLEDLRRGGFEQMEEKIGTPDFFPDYGRELHPSYGITALGVRDFLIAYNIVLNSEDIYVATRIAKAIRYSSGGLRYVKAMGVPLHSEKKVQVSMNLTNYRKTPIYRVFEMVKSEASRYGVSIAYSELIGLSPLEAMTGVMGHYLQLKDASPHQVLEKRIYDAKR